MDAWTKVAAGNCPVQREAAFSPSGVRAGAAGPGCPAGLSGNNHWQPSVPSVKFGATTQSDATIYDHCVQCLHGAHPAAGFPAADDGVLGLLRVPGEHSVFWFWG